MNNTKSKIEHYDGYFDIARESSTLDFVTFWQQYIVTEQPCIIEKIGTSWRASTRWTEAYLKKRLAQEPSAKAATLWYWMEKDALNEDYITPDIVNKTLARHDIMPRTNVMRIWVHSQGNLSSWHYDGNMVSVFNVQITGSKTWVLVSPTTPLDCYPFTNFAILDGKGDHVLQNKRYTRFVLNEGDMLYLPPLWFHRVEACAMENISLNWIFTKRVTQVTTDCFKRDYERYFMSEFFSKHQSKLLRDIFHKVNRLLPNYLRLSWQYESLIQTPYQVNLFNLLARVGKEVMMAFKVIPHVHKIKPYMNTVKPVQKI
jgi:hypothetical protein